MSFVQTSQQIRIFLDQNHVTMNVCCECYLNCRTNRRRWTENLWQLTSLRCFLLAWRPLINLCNTWSNILFFKHGTFYSSSKSMPLLLRDWAIFCFLFNKSFSPRGKIIMKRKYENGWIVLEVCSLPSRSNALSLQNNPPVVLSYGFEILHDIINLGFTCKLTSRAQNLVGISYDDP